MRRDLADHGPARGVAKRLAIHRGGHGTTHVDSVERGVRVLSVTHEVVGVSGSSTCFGAHSALRAGHPPEV